MADIQAIATELSGLSVMQVAELVKMLEEKWGVSAAAAAPVMMAAAGGAAPAAAAEEQHKHTRYPGPFLTPAVWEVVGRPGAALEQ